MPGRREDDDAAEILRLRERIHAHDLDFTLNAVRLVKLETTQDSMVKALTGLVSADQLETLSVKLDHVTEVVDTIKRGIFWVIGIILATLLIAGLGLLLRTPTHGG